MPRTQTIVIELELRDTQLPYVFKERHADTVQLEDYFTDLDYAVITMKSSVTFDEHKGRHRQRRFVPSVQQTRDALSLVDDREPDMNKLKELSDSYRLRLSDWAWSVHRHASDNDITGDELKPPLDLLEYVYGDPGIWATKAWTKGLAGTAMPSEGGE